jgi:hypothetical protein
MRTARTQAVSKGTIKPHEIRIVADPARQRARAECDRHGWQSEWCAQGPGHPYDPEEGWTPPATLIERVAVFGEQHLRAGSRRIYT